jgi:hypothetical protein
VVLRSGFASVMPTLVIFQLCGDGFKSLRSLTEFKFLKTLLVDFYKSTGHLKQVNFSLYIYCHVRCVEAFSV